MGEFDREWHDAVELIFAPTVFYRKRIKAQMRDFR